MPAKSAWLSRLNRYILAEVLKWYAAGFALFVLLQTTDALSNMVGAWLQYDATPAQGLQTFFYVLPTMLNRAAVLAVPFAVLLSFGRMQGDSEIKAAYAGGVRPLTLVWPLALPFLLVGALTFWNAGWVVPWANQNWDRSWYEIYGMTPSPPTRELYTFSDGETLFYAGRIANPTGGDEATLSGVMVQRDGLLVTADSGVWNAEAQTWRLDYPWVQESGADPVLSQEPLTFAQTDTLAPPRPDTEQISTPQLQADLASGALEGSERRASEYRLAARVAESFTALIFAVAAGLLGLLMPNRAWAFAAVLLVIVVYYVPWTLGPQMAANGALTPALVAWLPNLIFVALAGALAWRLR